VSQVKFYIAPFDNLGAYTSYVDVTEDVSDSVGSITKKLDVSDFDLGTLRSSDISFRLRNDNGNYSDIDGVASIFKYKRSNSKVKVTWQIEDDIVECGYAVCGGASLSEEITLFEGLLNDETSKESLETSYIDFKALSFESLFDKEIIDTTDFDNGDTIAEVIYKMLSNNSNITSYLTVSSGNISYDTSNGAITIDDKTELENQTFSEAFSDLLAAGNSIMYLDDSTIYVTPRTATATVQYTFYGQASDNGIESVAKISKISQGLNRTFNFASWEDYSTPQVNASSRSTYGTRKKEVGYDFITTNGTKDIILNNTVDEFGDPKRELELTSPITYNRLELGILDRVNIDYPTPVFIAPGDTFPIFGVSKYGTGRFPFAEASLVLTTTDYFKIIGYKIDLKSENIIFKLREI